MLTPIKRSLLLVAGFIALALGIVGIFLPLLPTVPFVLLASFCFARSSERIHALLINNKHFGPIIKNYEEDRGVPKRVKVRAITIVWISMGVSAWIVGRPLLWLILAIVGLSVSVYLYRLPEYKPEIDKSA